MALLEPCPSCMRHVRRDVTRCPFCDATVSFAGVPQRVLPTRRLSRAAMASFAVVVGAGCAQPTTPTDAGAMDASVDDAGAMDASVDDTGPNDASDYGDAVCLGGPDTGYGSPPFGYCCEHDCCHVRSWHGCADPYPDADTGGGDR